MNCQWAGGRGWVQTGRCSTGVLLERPFSRPAAESPVTAVTILSVLHWALYVIADCEVHSGMFYGTFCPHVDQLPPNGLLSHSGTHGGR